MPPEGTDAGQQGNQPTGGAPAPAAGTQPPAQPTPPSPPAQPTPPQPGEQQPTADWHTRYNGLQQTHQNTVEELKKAQALLQQYSQHAGTLEQQLNASQDGHVQTAEQLQQSQGSLATAQRENQFWNLVATEFPTLMRLAPDITRVDDIEQQREVLKRVASVVGASVQQQANAQVAQALGGVTPGATPPVGGGAPQFDRGDVYEKLLASRPGTPEYAKWKKIWDEQTKGDPKMLHPEWTDPVESDWERIEDAPGYLEPKTEPGTPDPFLTN
jgi:hypothetical protein